MKKLYLLLNFFGSGTALAESLKLDFFCDQLLQEEPTLSNYSDYFTLDFQNAVPLEHLFSIFDDLFYDLGSCVSFEVVAEDQRKMKLVLKGEKEIEATFRVTIDQDSGLIDGLVLDEIFDPTLKIGSWNDVESALQKIAGQGRISATLSTHDQTISYTYNPNEVFAIASTFKLYVLGALLQSIQSGEHTWDKILLLKEDWKSLPSGVMQDWEVGSKIPLDVYAEKMISLSDNTATDHLLFFLGRKKVENILEQMGNFHQKMFGPLLSTLEMFKLKWAIDPEATENYIHSSVESRLSFLESLLNVPRSKVGTNGVPLDRPTWIKQLEWYATTQENCNAMFWLAKQNDQKVKEILSKFVPGIDVKLPNSHWTFAGYKGGSEPGVLGMTFLLESKKGNRACLSFSWNNDLENLSQNRFFDVVVKTLKFAETAIP